ncbi:3-oxoacyl-(acyl-carrier-protein) synthase, KASIII [Pseudomonas sp. OF001]|uniref:ketoacyl-ACP synthase III n=1 Tax=Pseudomonas sp. OF001 TaxID=2772300 RepID=UPI0019195E13|nr:ketoacyl-ACP synthase III [Pseudomonas sp. OF001]CAD5375455.1 3-oxoacyl-(acyl-carrier-protein) synthase, KASIII [Pseudomonas sp. OF001]
MIGIKSIASYIPAGRIDNIAQAASFDRDEAFVASKIGTATLSVKDAAEETSDLCAAAVRNLLAKNPELRLEDVQALIVVTQNGDGEGLPHTSAIAQHKIGLPTCVACFDVSLGCSGFVYGLYAIKGFMEATGLKNGILVTADPYSKIMDRSDRMTTLLFGDAATATWIGEDPVWELGPARFGTDGSGADHLIVRDGCFHMNGRQVFNFASLKIIPHMQEVLEEAGLSLDSVDAYCLHQGSGAIVDAIAKRLGENGDRVVKDMFGAGNTVSSTIPLLMERYAFEGSAWKNLVMSGFGVGLSWGSAVLLRR